MTDRAPTVRTLYPWREVELPASPFPGYHGFNPSVHHDGTRWRCLVRHCNYDARGGHYNVRNGRIRTRNLMLDLDAGLQVTDATEVNEVDGLRRHPTPNYGYEDARLFATTRDGLLAVATTTQLRMSPEPEMVVLRLDDGYQVVDALPVRGDWSRLPQKNWSPYDGEQGVVLLYSADRNIVVYQDGPEWGWLGKGVVSGNTPDATPDAPASIDRHPSQAPHRRGVQGSVETRSVRPAQPQPRRRDTWSDYGGLRGGSQLIRVADRWLGVGHDMDVDLHRATGHKYYRHRFYSPDGARGPWFTFGHAGIEFCAGLAWDGERLVLSFGVEDCEAWLGVTDLAAVLATLQPPEAT